MGNAHTRLTLRGRCLLVRRVVFDGRTDGRALAHVATERRGSRQYAQRQARRFRDQGWAGLVERRSGPRACPSQITPSPRSGRAAGVGGPGAVRRASPAPMGDPAPGVGWARLGAVERVSSG
ncbi:hypothetical protein GWI34_25730 [Actinomadura sp. DSM 109109]|nr:hypothetical protein [Actinomadura lepetitiana]